MSIRVPANLDVLFKWQAGLGDSGRAPIKIDLTGGDWTPPAGFEVGKLTCTGGSKIVIDWTDNSVPALSVTGLSIPANPIIPIFNVSKIYQTGTDATDIVAWPVTY